MSCHTPEELEQIHEAREVAVQERRRQLQVAMDSKWYAQENDVIGGFCLTMVDAPPSTGAMELACFVNEDHAKHIAELHNNWLLHEQLH